MRSPRPIVLTLPPPRLLRVVRGPVVLDVVVPRTANSPNN